MSIKKLLFKKIEFRGAKGRFVLITKKEVTGSWGDGSADRSIKSLSENWGSVPITIRLLTNF